MRGRWLQAMTEAQTFKTIDIAIETFKKNEGFRKGIKVSKRPHSDWLIFNWRQLTWTENGINYLIEIYPEFNDKEKVTSWTLYTAASYDLDKKRYYIKHSFAKEKDLTFIANHMAELLISSFNFITNFSKKDIPLTVDLK